MISTAHFWTDKTVFVTGATGLLGGWLVESLIKQNARVVCLIRDVTPQSIIYSHGLSDNIISVYGDLNDLNSLYRILNDYDIDTVFHLGAQAIVGHAQRSPLDTFKSNIEGTWNILEACRLSPWVKRIIVASSDKAYGDSNQLPYQETMPLKGEHPYDVSKSCADLICRSYFVTYQLPVCVTRCGNIFGGGDFHFDRLIPGTIRSLLFNQAPLLRSDGLSIRDYIYVKDVVDAYLLIAERMQELSLSGESFNISEELPKNVLEVVRDLQQKCGDFATSPIITNSGRGEIKNQFLSCKKIHSVLDWKPSYGYDKGLDETIAWYKNYFSTDRQKTSFVNSYKMGWRSTSCEI